MLKENDDNVDNVVNSVIKDKTKPWEKKIKIGELELIVPQKSLIKKGDKVLISNDGSSITCLYPNNEFTVLPKYQYNTNIKIGNHEIKVKAEEISTEFQLKGYNNLRKFHYLSERGFPREIILIASIEIFGSTFFIGYISLTIASLMNKARHNLLNNSYNNNNVKWDTWGAKTMKKYVNRICNISRLLIHPEFRGMGITKVLLSAGIEYCSKRWHVKGKKPIFLEITALMLKYNQFPLSANMIYIGTTQGNLKRIYSDLKYNIKKDLSSLPSGVSAMQSSYVTKFLQKCDNLNLDIHEGLEFYKDVNIVNYYGKLHYLYKGIVRVPKPVYMIGLDTYSQDYILNNSKSINFSLSNENNTKIQNFNISILLNLKNKDQEKLIIKEKQLIVIYGLSNSGKSIQLKNIEEQLKYTKEISILNFNKISFGDRPLIDEFKNPIHLVLQIFSTVGLLDPINFDKPYSQLSTGLKYRAKLAKLLLSNNNLILIDNFGFGLDPLSLFLITNKFQKIISQTGKTIILTITNHYLIKFIKPTQLIIKYPDYSSKIIKNNKFTIEKVLAQIRSQYFSLMR